jgi:cell division protein FtsW (lipid II flippase)
MITLEHYVVELSKYVLMSIMMLYASLCFVPYIFLQEKLRDRYLEPVKTICYGAQNICMLILLFLCFLNLTFVSGEANYLYLFAFLLVFLFLMILLVSLIYEDSNRLLLNNTCLLLGLGLCIISRLSFQKAFRQYLIALLSFGVCLAIPYLLDRFRFWKKLTWAYALVGISMLSIVLIVGETTNGSKISFSLAGITFQPSEFVKILFLFFVAGLLWKEQTLNNLILSAVVAGLHVIILVVSKDLGSALIFFVTYVLVVVMTTGNFLLLLLGGAGGVLAAIVAYNLFDHVKVRFLAWQDPWTYIDKQGYQITQSLFAISSGGLFGMGLMQGEPKDIPFVEADMIFSAICEEFGLIFAICLILVCISCFVEMLLIAVRVLDRFYQMIVYGIAVMYLFQIFLTVGGGIKFIPLTGVTLPFISYGGSSVMTTMIMFFLVQAIYIRLCQVNRTMDRLQKKESV